jgi:acetolactate synthase-1/2/3 large subunit
MDPGPLGTLGVGTPFAMAAKFVHPEKEVLCYFGDGAFAMTGFDMETCMRFKLPFLGVIGNNSAMNQIRFGQIAKYGENRGNVGNKLGDVPFSKFAEMLGGYGEEVRDPKQLRPGREAVKSGVVALINVWVDPNVYAPGTKNQTMYK